MFKNAKLYALSAVAALGLAAGAANADETRIRQWDQNTQVIGYAGCTVYFTVSGFPSDTLISPFYCGPLAGAPYVYEVVRHSGGQTSFRFAMPGVAAWNMLTINLFRGGALVDGDRIRIF